MHAPAKKCKYILFPFLLIAIGFIVTYSLFNYTLFIKPNTLPFSDSLVNIAFPLFLSYIPLTIWLRPRLLLVKFFKEHEKRISNDILLVTIAIGLPTFFAQHYIKDKYGMLIYLDNINHLNASEQGNNYVLKNYFIDKKHFGYYVTSDYSTIKETKKAKFNMHIYIYMCLPILASQSDTADSKVLAWLGVYYTKTKTISNYSTNREEVLQTFINSSTNAFYRTDFTQFAYLINISNGSEANGFKEAMQKNTKYTSENPIIFEARTEQFTNNTGFSIAWMILSFVILGGGWFAGCLFTKLDEEVLLRFEK